MTGHGAQRGDAGVADLCTEHQGEQRPGGAAGRGHGHPKDQHQGEGEQEGENARRHRVVQTTNKQPQLSIGIVPILLNLRDRQPPLEKPKNRSNRAPDLVDPRAQTTNYG